MSLDIIAFGAHPDDVELAASGTLIKAVRAGSTVGVITLTRGEMGSRGTLAARAAEFDAAAAVMGLAHHEMLAMRDGWLSPDEPSRMAVVREIREHRPRIVLLPWGEDRHPDHGAACRMIQEAAFLAGLSKLDTGQQPHRPSMLVYYMSAWEFEPSFVVDISGVIEEKRRAILAYGTQVFTGKAAGTADARQAGPPTVISSQHYQELLFSRMAHYGHLIGKSYGEPFRIMGTIEITDLVEAFGGRTF
jgi:N-acetylglucosamine malate deacetylase 1